MAAGRKCRQHDKTLHVVMYNKTEIVLDLYVGFGRIINTLRIKSLTNYIRFCREIQQHKKHRGFLVPFQKRRASGNLYRLS